jgi:hypothetical protein
MIRFDNPVFITQRRLIRKNAFAAIFLGALGVGALIVILHLNVMEKTQSAVRRVDVSLVFYAWILALQGFLAVLAGGARVARGIADEHKSGRLEANRLTPLSVAQLLVGYTLGLPFLFVVPALALAPFGALVLAIGGAPLYVFVNSQLLLVGTAILTWLTTVILGLAFKKNQAGSVVLVLLLFAGFPMAAEVGSAFIGTFIFPFFPILADFAEAGMGRMRNPDTTFFGFGVSRLFLAVAIQGACAALLWRAARRKLTDPEGPAFSPRLAMIAFAFLAVTQYGVAWSELHDGSVRHLYQGLTVIHGGLLFVGVVLLMGLAVHPSRLRRLVLAHSPDSNAKTSGPFLAGARQGLVAALVFAAISAGMLVVNAFFGPGSAEAGRVLVASLCTLSIFVGLAAALDVGAFAFGAQARPAVLGVFFLLLIGTLVVGAISKSEAFMVVTSPVVDAMFALGSSNSAFKNDPGFLVGAGAILHLLVAGGLVILRKRMTHQFVLKTRSAK